MSGLPARGADPAWLADIQGVRVPRLGFGTYKLTGAACVEGVADALALGYRHIDTARMYGNEAQVGEGLVRSGVPRDQVFLTTKIWPDHLAAPALRAETEASLASLRCGWIDLLLVHWPNPAVPLEETLGELQALQREGTIRLFGVSNFPWSLVEKALEVAPIAMDQVELHPWQQERELRPRCRERGVWITGYKPLAHGRVHDDPVLGDIAAAHGCTPAQVALRWQLSLDGVLAIPKAAHAERRRENLAVLDLQLREEDLQRIADLDEDRRLTVPAWGPRWGRGGL